MTTITRPDTFLPPDLMDGLDDPDPFKGLETIASGETKTKSIVIVAESGDLERTWATTILASTAAASGMQVSIFFTFWGLFPLVRPEIRMTGKNWMQKMLAVMNRPGIGHLKLSKLNFAGMGPWMMHRLARQHGVAKPGELLEMAQALGVRLIPCQMSMDMMGVSADQLIEGVEPAVGAATALELMAEADATLFI
jgi:peroxiredoxin family protein